MHRKSGNLSPRDTDRLTKKVKKTAVIDLTEDFDDIHFPVGEVYNLPPTPGTILNAIINNSSEPQVNSQAPIEFRIPQDQEIPFMDQIPPTPIHDEPFQINLLEDFSFPDQNFSFPDLDQIPPLQTEPNQINSVSEQETTFISESTISNTMANELSPLKIDDGEISGGEIKFKYSIQDKTLSISMSLSYDYDLPENFITPKISSVRGLIHGRLRILRKEKKAAFVWDKKLNDENIKDWIGVIKIFNVFVQADQVILIDNELHAFIRLLIQNPKLQFQKKKLNPFFDNLYNQINKSVESNFISISDEPLVQNIAISNIDPNPSIQSEPIQNQAVIPTLPKKGMTFELSNKEPNVKFECLLTLDNFLNVKVYANQACIEGKLNDFKLTKMFTPVVISFYKNTKDGYGEMIFHNLLFDSSELAFIHNEISSFITECLRKANKEKITRCLSDFLAIVKYQDKLIKSIKLPETDYSTIKDREDPIKLTYSIQNNNTLSVLMVFANVGFKESKHKIAHKIQGRLSDLKDEKKVNFGKKTISTEDDSNIIDKIIIYNVSFQADQFKSIEKDLSSFIKLLLSQDLISKEKISEDFHKFYDEIKIRKEATDITVQKSTVMNSQESTSVISQKRAPVQKSVISKKGAINSHPAPLFWKPSPKPVKNTFRGKIIEVNYATDQNNQLLIKFVIRNDPDRKQLTKRIKEINSQQVLHQDEFNTNNVSVLVPIQISENALQAVNVLKQIERLTNLILGTDSGSIPSIDEINTTVNTILKELQNWKDLVNELQSIVI